MAELSLTNIINISVAQAQAGVGDYNTSNLAIFSHEPYDANTFGDDGYKIYLSPIEVGEDFGTSSQTYSMAVAVFSQRPNILAGNGYLTVIPFIVETQSITPSGVPASGSYKLNFGGDVTAAIQYNATAEQIQDEIRTLTGLEDAVVTGTLLAGPLQVKLVGYYGDAALMTVTDNNMQTSAPAAVNLVVAQVSAGETMVAAINRTVGLVQYLGLMATLIIEEAQMLAAAALVQTMNKMYFVVSDSESSVEVAGYLYKIMSGGLSQTRGLYYGEGSASDSLNEMAAYAGRLLSVNFEGSNTTINMHLKDLNGIQPDSTLTQTLLQKCQDAGVDVYGSFQGVPKVFTSGKNEFVDQVYNLLWFVGALQVAGFNFLAQSATKVPQTENGMDGLKSAYRKVCEQALTNQYAAPGVWNSSTTFGVQADFIQNIEQRGYYIYSQPIALQSQSAREAREAPLVQIALKEAGAINKSNVIVYVNK